MEIRTLPSKKNYFIIVGLAIVLLSVFIICNFILSTFRYNLVLPDKKDVKLRTGTYNVFREVSSTGKEFRFKTGNVGLSGISMTVFEKETNAEILNLSSSSLASDLKSNKVSDLNEGHGYSYKD